MLFLYSQDSLYCLRRVALSPTHLTSPLGGKGLHQAVPRPLTSECRSPVAFQLKKAFGPRALYSIRGTDTIPQLAPSREDDSQAPFAATTGQLLPYAGTVTHGRRPQYT